MSPLTTWVWNEPDLCCKAPCLTSPVTCLHLLFSLCDRYLHHHDEPYSISPAVRCLLNWSRFLYDLLQNIVNDAQQKSVWLLVYACSVIIQRPMSLPDSTHPGAIFDLLSCRFFASPCFGITHLPGVIALSTDWHSSWAEASLSGFLLNLQFQQFKELSNYKDWGGTQAMKSATRT